MSDREDLAAIVRPLAEELVRPEDAALEQTVRRITRGGTKVVLGHGTVGHLPPNQTGVVQDESVQTVLVGFPGLTNQELTNIHLLAAIGALSVAAFDPDTILTDLAGDVLVDNDGNVIVEGGA